MKAANLLEANSFSLTKYLTVILVMIQFWTQAQTTFPTLPYTDLQKLNRSLPYVRFYGADSSLLVFGSNHTNQFDDPQIRLIRDLILSFHPTIVLYEGDGIGTEATGKETTETYFEMGFAKFIADSLGIESGNIEPPTHGKFKHLLKRYSVDDVMLATLGLQITMMQVNNDPFEATYPTMTSDLVREGLSITPEQSTLANFIACTPVDSGKSFPTSLLIRGTSRRNTVARSSMKLTRRPTSSATNT